jgi:hypothetical protein
MASLCRFALLALLAFAPVAGGANDAPDAVLYVAPATIHAKPGSSVTVAARITVSGDTANAVAAIIEYSPAMLTYLGSEINSAVWDVTAAQSATAGKVDIEVGTTTPVTGDQLVATVTFAVVAAGDIPISIADTSAVVSSTTNTDLLRHPPALSISGLRAGQPALRFTARLSRPTILDITLLDTGGKRLGAWHKHAASGTNAIALALPPQARHAGRVRLTIGTTGSNSVKKLWITLR